MDKGTPPSITAAVLWVTECDQMYMISRLLFQAGVTSFVLR